MKERVRFAVGAASMVLAACCLMGALFTAWLRCAAGAVNMKDIKIKLKNAGKFIVLKMIRL